jgi:tRNA1(Val) A37 N6-methylase TrmN6
VTAEKAGGATYTPSLLADFVARQIVAAADLTSTDGVIHALDPAVGGGELLISLMKELAQHTKRPIAVHGFDTDKGALAEARDRIAGAYPHATLHLEQANFLEYVIEQPAKNRTPSLFSRRAPQSFDLIIANPPYVRTQIMGARQAQGLAEAFSLAGRVDLYHAFLIAMAQVLPAGGTAGIIVSNRFMTTRGGASVRQALRERFELRHIWDLGDTKLFGAAVLPAVILAGGRNGREYSPPALSSIYETDAPASSLAGDPIQALDHTGAVALPDGRNFRVQHGVLRSGALDTVWSIASASKDAWLASVDARSWGTFRDIGRVRVGVKTCADTVFIRSDWHELPAAMRPELLRPVTTHHIGRRFKALAAKKPRAILYPHENVDGRRRAVDLSAYPRSRTYLEGNRTAMGRREYVTKGGRQWYEIWVPQDPAAWSAPKLVFRDIAQEPTFWIDLDGTIVNGDCYWLTADRSDCTELLWLAVAVANSTFIEAFYDHRFNNKLYAGRRRFITQYVEQFPLPDPSTPLAREIIALAKSIYELVDTPQAAKLAKQLGPMVWQAFGLRFEEVYW